MVVKIPRDEMTRDIAMQSLSYCPYSGIVSWVIHTRGRGGHIKPGDAAGTIKDGYVQIKLHGSVYRGHRLAWLLFYGEWPDCGLDIDHINGDRADNRISNLRLSSRSQNNINSRLRANNTSGVTGVSYKKDTGKWHARIGHDDKKVLLGDYDKFEDAVKARMNAELSIYGEFRQRS